MPLGTHGIVLVNPDRVQQQPDPFFGVLLESVSDDLVAELAPADPTAILTRWSRFTGVAPDTACILPPARAGSELVIRNDGLNSLDVFPCTVTESIATSAPGDAFPLPAATEIVLRCFTTGAWSGAVSN